MKRCLPLYNFQNENYRWMPSADVGMSVVVRYLTWRKQAVIWRYDTSSAYDMRSIMSLKPHLGQTALWSDRLIVLPSRPSACRFHSYLEIISFINRF